MHATGTCCPVCDRLLLPWHMTALRLCHVTVCHVLDAKLCKSARLMTCGTPMEQSRIGCLGEMFGWAVCTAADKGRGGWLPAWDPARANVRQRISDTRESSRLHMMKTKSPCTHCRRLLLSPKCIKVMTAAYRDTSKRQQGACT